MSNLCNIFALISKLNQVYIFLMENCTHFAIQYARNAILFIKTLRNNALVWKLLNHFLNFLKLKLKLNFTLFLMKKINDLHLSNFRGKKCLCPKLTLIITEYIEYSFLSI